MSRVAPRSGTPACSRRRRPGGLTRRALARFARDTDGGPALEFAMVMPVFMMMMLGVANVGQIIYAKILLNGAVEQAARTSATENGDTTAADNTVQKIVGPIVPGGTFTTTRYSYYDFSDVGRAEKYTDSNGDGRCDNNETYIDENANSQWDSNIGNSGNGNADDVVVYQVTLRYTPVFKVPFMPNQWNQFTLVSKSVKKNQPFATQSNYATTTRTCA